MIKNLVLKLFQGFALLTFLVLVLSSCNRKAPTDLLQTYWSALAVGDLAAAYELLSTDDKEFLELDTYEAYMREQPSMRFLFLSSGAHNREEAGSKEKGEAADSVVLDIRDVQTSGKQARVHTVLGLPDLSALGLLDLETVPEGDIVAESRLIRQLTQPRAFPVRRYSHTFDLVKEEGKWRIQLPRWRARAMLAAAKQKSAERDLAGARDVLNALVSSPAEKFDAATVRAARRASRMLGYMRHVDLKNFERLRDPQEGCSASATLDVNNEGDFAIDSLEGVVEFQDVNGEVLGQQTVVLGTVNSPVPARASTPFELCLEPSQDWSGRAAVWVSWLEFPDEVYKQGIR